MSATSTTSTNITGLMIAINQYFVSFLQALPNKRGKVKVADVVVAFQEAQEELTKIVQTNLPKTKRTREKKLKDPEAPKRPKSSYLFFCAAKRDSVKKKNPDAKVTEISKELGKMWRALNPKKKKKYEKKAATDKERYTREMKDYERPCDEELAKLKVNQRRGSRTKGGSKRKKRDPNAPKRFVSAYLYFCKDMRSKLKEEEPNMTPQEVSRTLGQMWKTDYGDEKKRKKWIKLSNKDKKRYEEEMANYTPPERNDEEVSAPKKKAHRVHKKKKEEVESGSDSEVEPTPKRKSPRKEVVPPTPEEDDSSDSDSEENTRKSEAKKAKSQSPRKRAERKKIGKQVKFQVPSNDEAMTEEDLFEKDSSSDSDE